MKSVGNSVFHGVLFRIETEKKYIVNLLHLNWIIEQQY